jgi:hypothetical protein
MVRPGRASYAREMDVVTPQEPSVVEQGPELTETEAAEIEDRLRALGYLE